MVVGVFVGGVGGGGELECEGRRGWWWEDCGC